MNLKSIKDKVEKTFAPYAEKSKSEIADYSVTTESGVFKMKGRWTANQNHVKLALEGFFPVPGIPVLVTSSKGESYYCVFSGIVEKCEGKNYFFLWRLHENEPREESPNREGSGGTPQ